MNNKTILLFSLGVLALIVSGIFKGLDYPQADYMLFFSQGNWLGMTVMYLLGDIGEK